MVLEARSPRPRRPKGWFLPRPLLWLSGSLVLTGPSLGVHGLWCLFLFLPGHQSCWVRAPPLGPHLIEALSRWSLGLYHRNEGWGSIPSITCLMKTQPAVLSVLPASALNHLKTTKNVAEQSRPLGFTSQIRWQGSAEFFPESVSSPRLGQPSVPRGALEAAAPSPPLLPQAPRTTPLPRSQEKHKGDIKEMNTLSLCLVFS